MRKAVIFYRDRTTIDSGHLRARVLPDVVRDHGCKVGFEDLGSRVFVAGGRLTPLPLSEDRLHLDRLQAALGYQDDTDFRSAFLVRDTPCNAEAAGGARLHTTIGLLGGLPKPGLRDAGCNAIHAVSAVLFTPHERSTPTRNGAAL